jgi:hypothetical protein
MTKEAFSTVRALKLALDALETSMYPQQKQLQAITAIKEALMSVPDGAQPSVSVEQEPLEYWNAVEGWVKIDEVREHFDSVGCGTIYKTAGEDRTPLYTTPPPVAEPHKRPSRSDIKPLTDEEIGAILEGVNAYGTRLYTFARAIEAVHGINEIPK